MVCNICPRNCRADRSKNSGFCCMGDMPKVAKAYLHMWEEPCISGTRGSGTVFFSGCNLKCIFCQNYKISQENVGMEVTTDKLAQIFIRLQEKEAHNINLVNPTHFVPQIREALLKAENLSIPVVYNSNGYEKVETLKTLEGLVDVYLPDLKYYSPDISRKYSGASDYFETATAAIMEMYRQVGGAVFDENGILRRGMIIRHLILPGMAKQSIKILDWIKANLPCDVLISLMSQYTPYYKAEEYPEINRRITRYEYDMVVNHCLRIGLDNGYIQERDSAEVDYIPDFNMEGVDF